MRDLWNDAPFQNTRNGDRSWPNKWQQVFVDDYDPYQRPSTTPGSALASLERGELAGTDCHIYDHKSSNG